MRRSVILSIIFLLSLISNQHVLADEAVPFDERNGIKYVTAYINGAPIELVFDTGANKVVLNSEGLLSIGVKEFDDTQKSLAHTAGGVTEVYIIKIGSIRVGNIQKNDYDVAYIPSSTKNLLGASFFTSYSYFVDEDYKVIRLIPKGSYFFDSLEQPAVDQHRTGSGLIEVEMDGEKYIYEDGRLIRQGQDTPKVEMSR
jgi:clan AA aspartic protease (TIGR02281 family)